MKRVGQWAVIFWVVGCATVDAPSEGELDDENSGTGGSGEQPMGSGGVVVSTGSGGAVVIGGDGDGDGDTGGTILGGDGDGDTGGTVIIGGDGDGDTGGTVIIGGDGDGDTGGGLIGDGDGDTGGGLIGDGDGDTGGTTSTGGAANPGSPSDCLLDWDTTPEGDDCLNAGQADWESGCTNLLNCWQTNDCTPTECSASPDGTCGQNTIMNATPGMSYAEGVFAALCE